MPVIVRLTGATLACLGAGGLFLLWSHAESLLRMSGKGLREFLGFAFLGEAISWIDLGLHDTYYLVANPIWAWLSLLACLAGILMATCPDWLSRNRDGRE